MLRPLKQAEMPFFVNFLAKVLLVPNGAIVARQLSENGRRTLGIMGTEAITLVADRPPNGVVVELTTTPDPVKPRRDKPTSYSRVLEIQRMWEQRKREK